MSEKSRVIIHVETTEVLMTWLDDHLERYGYNNKSEFVRTAIREKMERDEGQARM